MVSGETDVRQDAKGNDIMSQTMGPIIEYPDVYCFTVSHGTDGIISSLIKEAEYLI